MISIKNLNKFFNKGKPNEIHVVDNVSLELPDRGMVAIFGKSGCGKTTLLNLIGGLDSFSRGNILVFGRDISSKTDEIRNKHIGYIFQNYNLNGGESCYENVADALRLCGVTDINDIDNRVRAALRNVGMEKYAKRSPDTLSGGQQQRVAIARAIVKNPEIILADEPTGNLDESNTVLVMDLLKEISRDRLVLLVTHEVKLVDHYCDTVIELSDGKVVSIRSNADANGYTAKNKNCIYLGELEKSDTVSDTAEIEYYGDKPTSPIKLKIVNNNGKTYVKVCTEGVRVIDDSTEIKLLEGVFDEEKHDNKDCLVDMSELTSINGNSYGRLFTLISSIKSGIAYHFSKNKKNTFLRYCLMVLAMIAVVLTAVFSTSIGDLQEIDGLYNHNSFYALAESESMNNILSSAAGIDGNGVDYVRIENSRSDITVYFRADTFETFRDYVGSDSLMSNAVLLSDSLIEDKALLCGKKDNLEVGEVVISSVVADSIIKSSKVEYISDYKDLMNLLSERYFFDAYPMKIVGVVEDAENAIYANDISITKYTQSRGRYSNTDRAVDFGFTVADGETILLVSGAIGSDYPVVGDVIKIHGIDLTVKRIVTKQERYIDWLSANGISKTAMYEYMVSLLVDENPSLTEGTEEFASALARMLDDRYFEYYDYYYSEFENFIRDLYVFGDVRAWIYCCRGEQLISYAFLPEEYSKAIEYKNRMGRYPTKTEFDEKAEFLPSGISTDELVQRYYDEYYSADVSQVNESLYLIGEGDFVKIGQQRGETHKSALGSSSAPCYLIHSYDTVATEAWLREVFAENGADEMSLYTPDRIYESIIYDAKSQILSQIVSLIITLFILCICMYFIVRSSLLNRVKEIGIYRAIGVSKKNVIFKFLIEALVLACISILPGYLISSGFILLTKCISPYISSVFYYPWWIAFGVLAILLGFVMLFGVLPVRILMRKTPSEILSKYDV